MSFKQTGESVFKIFAAKEGSAHIASQNALYGILKNINKYNCTNILEVGIGIGTIPYTINEYAIQNLDKKIAYSGIEENEFCINQFKKNINKFANNFSFSHYVKAETIPEQFFDFVVVDGENAKLESIKKFIDPTRKTIIIIEGDRKGQVKTLRNFFTNYAFYREITLKKNPDYSPFPKEHYIHGYSVIILNPSLLDKVYEIYRRVVTYIKYWIRKFTK